jgi:DNA-binding CsgD family transcriptional regulator
MDELTAEKLTAKEMQVLKMIGHGNTSKEIASMLHVSLQTVANHRKHICSKLQLHSTAALVAYAARVVYSPASR